MTSPFWGETFPPIFLKIRQNSNPHLLCKVGGGGEGEYPAMINQNHLSLLFFGNRWDTGGESLIISDNQAGHCFLLSYLLPMNFFK